jgi:1,2-beta-oligoglucan phosphorylase
MPTSTSSPIAYPVHIGSPSGLQVQVNANGSIRRMDYRDILLNLFLGNEVEGGPTNIYLRRHGIAIKAVPILGLRSPAVFSLDQQGLTAR